MDVHRPLAPPPFFALSVSSRSELSALDVEEVDRNCPRFHSIRYPDEQAARGDRFVVSLGFATNVDFVEIDSKVQEEDGPGGALAGEANSDQMVTAPRT